MSHRIVISKEDIRHILKDLDNATIKEDWSLTNVIWRFANGLTLEVTQ